MKTSFFAVLLMLSISAGAQSPSRVVDLKPHKIVMHHSSSDSVDQTAILTQAGNILEAWPKATIEIVCHGPGLDILTIKKSKAAEGVADLSSRGVVFAACNNSMQARHLKKEDLLTVSVIVPSAMLEMVLKQEDGWAYLKAGR